jgi:hypothetical protein
VASLGAPAAAPEKVDLESMTCPEVAAAMQRGKTTVLIYTGGTEQRGPHVDTTRLCSRHALPVSRLQVRLNGRVS